MNQRTLQNISYFASLPEMALSFLLPLYCIELGFSPLETTGLFAVVSLALLAAKWCIGGLCDRIGRKKVFQMGLLLKGISYGLLAYAHSAGLLYVGQVLKGVALALVSVSLYAMLSDQKAGAFAARQSRIAAAEGRGQLLGVLLAWVLLLATTFEQGWQILLLVGAAAAFYGAALAHRQLEETQGGALRHGQKLPGKFYGLLTVSVWYSFATAAVGATLVLYLTARYQVRTEYLALVLLIPAVARTYLSPALGRMSAKIGERQAFALGSLLSAALLAAAPGAASPQAFLVVWTLYRVASALASFAFGATVAGQGEEGMRGRISGAYLASDNLGSLLGALLAGVLFQMVDLQAPFYLAAALFVVAAGTLWGLWKKGDGAQCKKMP